MCEHLLMEAAEKKTDVETFSVWRGNCENLLIYVWSIDFHRELPSGKRLQNYGKSPFSMGKSTISMAFF
jgi:hypothetical protein